MSIILVCDDDLHFEQLCSLFERENKRMEIMNGEGFKKKELSSEIYSLIILARSTDCDNINDLIYLREKNDKLPVIVITRENNPAQKTLALKSGADDSMSFPVDIEELRERINLRIREKSILIKRFVHNEEITIDTLKGEVVYRKKTVKLTRMEMDLLEIFVMNNKKTLSRVHLAKKLLQGKENLRSNLVDVYIHKLRKRFGRDFIITDFRKGYSFPAEKK